MKIAEIEYSDMEFIFVTHHWDWHLDGLCKFQNKLCRFYTKGGGWAGGTPEQFEDDDYEPYWIEPICEIHTLSWREKLKWLYRKKRFEVCVGSHYSYSEGKRGPRFYYRNPQCFYKMLFRIYYRLK